jgi:hypothetical protein
VIAPVVPPDYSALSYHGHETGVFRSYFTWGTRLAPHHFHPPSSSQHLVMAEWA